MVWRKVKYNVRLKTSEVARRNDSEKEKRRRKKKGKLKGRTSARKEGRKKKKMKEVPSKVALVVKAVCWLLVPQGGVGEKRRGWRV
ncbi:hypothetical protein IE53DRAFT_384999 [Violaceomyces palustris]|uniref:Uncharacterized protein n=1 Tax=Violaceomyces palustris TaxID=1673888 RepID=A0ACD0P3C8_9BASI|nr:hypothetical protein IE53DRAFT_384999 [Violaceomyces palustris]